MTNPKNEVDRPANKVDNESFSEAPEYLQLCLGPPSHASRPRVYLLRKCVYAPCINAPAHLVVERAMFAKQAGCGAVLMIPGITGFDTMR